MSLKREMPLLARHEGDWQGVYTVVDVNGRILDQHRSHLTCRFSESSPFPYLQTNRYFWDDGRTEEFEFPATYKDGRIWFDTARITGSAWEADEDTILLKWSYKGHGVNQSLVEMIQLDTSCRFRARTWHWFEDGRLVKRTLISEERMV